MKTAADAASYKWPETTEHDKSCRAAFCDGAEWAGTELEQSEAENKLLRAALGSTKEEILNVLEPEFYEELTHQQMKLIADQAARNIAKIVHQQTRESK